MDISVIIPVYNNEKYLRAALDSLLQQGPVQLEAIVIDDGSTDGSAQVAESFAVEHPYVRVIRQDNQGVSAARNRGLAEASGTYIAFLDSDDAFVSKALWSMYLLAERHEADIVFGENVNCRTFSNQKSVHSRRLSKKILIRRDDPEIVYNFSVCNKLFRRSVIEKHGVRFQRIRHAEDGLFLISVLQDADVITGCPRKVYEYHKRISLESRSALKTLDAGKLEGVLQMAEAVLKITADWSEAFRSAFCGRILRTTLLNEYYRRLWTLEDGLYEKLCRAVEQYRTLVSEEQWIKTVGGEADLELAGGLRDRQDVAEHPLISVIIPAGLTEGNADNLLNTLYYQLCPNFEVWMDAGYQETLRPEFSQMENLHFGQPGESAADLTAHAAGRFVQIADAPVIYDEPTLRLMCRRLLSCDMDGVAAGIKGYCDGTVYEPEQGTVYCCNRLFRAERLKQALETGTVSEPVQKMPPDVWEQRILELTCEPFDDVIMGICADGPPQDDRSGMEPGMTAQAMTVPPQDGVSKRNRFSRALRNRLPLNHKKVLILSEDSGETGGLPRIRRQLEQGGYQVAAISHSQYEALTGREQEKQWSLVKYILTDAADSPATRIPLRDGQERYLVWDAPKAFRECMTVRKKKDPVREQMTYFSKVIAPSDAMCEHLAQAFRLPQERLAACGLPDTDLYAEAGKRAAIRAQLEQKYPVLKGKQVILVMPEHRGKNAVKAAYAFKKLDPERIHAEMGRDYVLVFSWTRPLYGRICEEGICPYDFAGWTDFALDLTGKENERDLLLLADLLITDYSPVLFEYALMDKPVIYFWYDFNAKYLKQDTCFDLQDYVYGTVCYDTDDLIRALKSPAMCAQERAQFREMFLGKCDGRATERVCETLFDAGD